MTVTLSRHSILGATMVDPKDFRSARQALGLTQAQAAAMLGYGHRVRITEIEAGRKRPSNSVRRLLRAYIDGYRPDDWPLLGEQ